MLINGFKETAVKQIFLFIILVAWSTNCFSLNEETPKMSTHPVVLMTTNYGDIKIELDAEKAPNTVKNFLQYVNDGQFDHTIFHRVIDGFMIQGGGFTADMVQKKVRDPIENEAQNGLKNLKYTIAMARTSAINSATAQFFLNVANNDFLDHNPQNFGYAVFGKVISGTDVVDKIAKVKTGEKNGHRDVPKETVEIIKATVLP